MVYYKTYSIESLLMTKYTYRPNIRFDMLCHFCSLRLVSTVGITCLIGTSGHGQTIIFLFSPFSQIPT